MRHSKSILITLGHNSSVIFFQPGSNPIGYEEERLSGIKSDSSYPILALEKVLSQLQHSQITGCNVFISHWFDHFELEAFPKKYFKSEHFNRLVEEYEWCIIPLTSQFTHHDAHAYSTLAFSENFPTGVIGDKHFIVVDGFGNNQEVISIYKQLDDGRSSLLPIKRVYGYENSLGLLYQYATSFCGMKENQDEYKFLGYESDIKKVLSSVQIENLDIQTYKFSMEFMSNCLQVHNEKPVASNDTIIDFVKLATTKEKMHSMFSHVLKTAFNDVESNISIDDTLDRNRTVIGYFAQACLEQCLLRIIKKYDMQNVYLSGGCFLNVKLNKLILDSVKGCVCVNPLSGDQGAAIGMFRKYTNTQFDFADLCFGVRDRVELAMATKVMLINESIYNYSHETELINAASYFIGEGFIVNILQGDMEFGPRALCNTSTLALPTAENTAYINKVNERNEVMPMAPVMLKAKAAKLLKETDTRRVIGSNKYMIITHDFIGPDTENYRGILHTKPKQPGYTCRPQIIYDANSNIGRILSDLSHMTDCLINTSFNTHGRPILYAFESAIEDFRKQKRKDSEQRLILLILCKK